LIPQKYGESGGVLGLEMLYVRAGVMGKALWWNTVVKVLFDDGAGLGHCSDDTIVIILLL
jgi:hypothetical protein